MMHRVAVIGSLLLASVASASAQIPQRVMFEQPGFSSSGMESPFESVAISGSVRVTNGDASNVRIEIRDLVTGATVSQGFSSRGGTFNVRGLRPGEYEVVAISGMSEARERVTAKHGEAHVTLLMVQPVENKGGNSHSVSVAAMQVPDKPRKAIAKAQEALDAGKTDEARKQIEAALKAYPQFAEALAMRALIAMNEGDNQSAIKDLDQAIKHDPKYSLAYVAMAAAYNGEQQFDDALRLLERASALAPNAWQVPFEYARALLGKAQWSEALKQAVRAEKLVPAPVPEILLVKAHALIGIKDYDGAIAEYEALLRDLGNSGKAEYARAKLAEVKAFAAQDSE